MAIYYDTKTITFFFIKSDKYYWSKNQHSFKPYIVPTLLEISKTKSGSLDLKIKGKNKRNLHTQYYVLIQAFQFSVFMTWKMKDTCLGNI